MRAVRERSGVGFMGRYSLIAATGFLSPQQKPSEPEREPPRPGGVGSGALAGGLLPAPAHGVLAATACGRSSVCYST